MTAIMMKSMMCSISCAPPFDIEAVQWMKHSCPGRIITVWAVKCASTYTIKSGCAASDAGAQVLNKACGITTASLIYFISLSFC